MKKVKIMKKIVTTGLFLILSFTLIMTFHAGAAPERQKIYVDPPESIFSTETTSVGDNFTIGICVGDWTDPPLWGYELKLGYDNTLLEAVEAWMPEGHFLTPEDPYKIYVVDPGTIYHDEGYVSFALTLMAPEPGHTGSGVLANITFTITTAPPAGKKVSCPLHVHDVVLVGFVEGAFEIPPEDYDIEDGYYEFTPPLLPLPWLKVEPEIVSAAELGDEFTVHVTINEVEDTLRLVGVEFKLRYNTTLLETKEEWITEGDFIKSFGATLFTASVEDDYALVNITLLTEEPPFPSGSGTLATIKFNATYIPETLTTSDLLLDDVSLVDVEQETIEYDHLEHGTYQVPLLFIREDLNQDKEVNIEDIAIWGAAFGSYPGHPRWEPVADINDDGKVNILDAVLIAQKFGLKY